MITYEIYTEGPTMHIPREDKNKVRKLVIFLKKYVE